MQKPVETQTGRNALKVILRNYLWLSAYKLKNEKLLVTADTEDFPGSTSGKETTSNAGDIRDMASISGLGGST